MSRSCPAVFGLATRLSKYSRSMLMYRILLMPSPLRSGWKSDIAEFESSTVSERAMEENEGSAIPRRREMSNAFPTVALNDFSIAFPVLEMVGLPVMLLLAARRISTKAVFSASGMSLVVRSEERRVGKSVDLG